MENGSRACRAFDAGLIDRVSVLPFEIPQPNRSLGILRRFDAPSSPTADRFTQHIIGVFENLKHTIKRHENAVVWSRS